MEEAWEAFHAGDLSAAVRLSRRARDAGSVNPRILLDHGRIMMACEEWSEAEDSLRAAIAAAPTYGEAFAALAELQFDLGKLPQSVRLQARAVELLSGDDAAARTLARYRAASGEDRPAVSEESGLGEVEAAVSAEAGRTAGFDWKAVAAEAKRRGAAPLRGLLTPAECEAMRGLYGDEACEPELVWDDEDGGRYACRYLSAPLPGAVQELREELFARAAMLANSWAVSLKKPRFPATLARYLADAAGHRCAARLLRFPGGGWLAFRREARRHAFPLQLLVDLGGAEPGEGEPRDAAGGELAIDDSRPGKKLRRNTVATRRGDGVLHCVQDRIVPVAGIDGLQPVLWSFTNTSNSQRLVLHLPFQDE